MSYFKVVYQDVETNSLMIEQVNQAKAAECKQKQGTSQGLYLGSAYISGRDIRKIQEVIEEKNRLQVPSCGKCEGGWLFGDKGTYPCSCNAKGRDEMVKYREQLVRQGTAL